MPRRWKLVLFLVPLSIAFDQVTKVWARSSLPTGPGGQGVPVPVIDGYFDWILAYNTGSAFSMFAGTAGSRIFLSAIGLAAVGAIAWMVHKATDQQRGLVVALALMAGGAIGNLIDRIAFGKVTDFVLWRYHEHHWPVFNVADVCLTVAVAMFLVISIRDARARQRSGDTAST